MNHFYTAAFKLFLSSILVLFTFAILHAQQDIYPCAASEMQRALFLKDPGLLQHQFLLDEDIRRHLQRQPQSTTLRSAAVFTIPVVVHIIHQNGAENISDAQVQNAIQHLNDAFAHQGYYGSAGLGATTPIQFCLAQRTPDNQPSNGINRDVSTLTEMNMQTEDLALKNLRRWDSRQYVNIWVVRDINSTTYGSGVAGYAYYASAHGSSVDGIVCEARYFGNSPANDVVLIHELGHYLNLYHTFEGGCGNNNCETEGDRVCDTPPDQAKHTGCVYNSCTTDADDARSTNPLKADVNDLTENYMDYSPFSCQHAFTPGQSARMLAALQTVRASLLNSPGCFPPCSQAITADFTLPSGMMTGSPYAFTFSGSGATLFEWKVNGIVVSTQQNPSYTFTTPGSYLIELYVRNGDANCWARKQARITVLCNVSAGFTPTQSTVKLGTPVTFTATGTGVTSYEWSINNTVVGTGNTYTQTFNTNGTYTVQLKTTNTNCSSIGYGQVLVNPPCGDSAGQGTRCPEICDNDIDDNGDGLIDCADPTCKCETCRQLPDGIIAVVDSIQCLGDSLRVYLQVCNQGQGILKASTPIAFYNNDPTLSNAIPLAALQVLGINITAGTCKGLVFKIKSQSGKPIFAVLNDNYLRPRPYKLERYLTEENPECSYVNNKFQFQFDDPMVPKLNLGPDRLVCDYSVTPLKATRGFVRYRWPDGSTDTSFTAFSPGIYWVEAWDACGRVQRDSIRLNLQPQGKIDLGADRSICPGDSVAFSVQGFDRVKWWPNNGLKCADCANLSAKPDSTTVYYVTANTGNCFAGDSIRITVSARPRVQLLPQDTLTCTQSAVSLRAQVQPANALVRWYNARNLLLNGANPLVNQSGIYRLEVSDSSGLCSSSSSVRVFADTLPPAFDLGADRMVCEANVVTIGSVRQPDLQYLWSTGAQDASITVTRSGSYTLSVQNQAGCRHIDTLRIDFAPPFRFTLGHDTLLCVGEKIQLPRGSIVADNYTWSTGIQTAAIEVDQPGSYALKAELDGCSWQDTIVVSIEPCNLFGVYIPNVFSTRSAVNGEFRPFFSTHTELLSYQFQIFDRWGEQVFATQDPLASWKGDKAGRMYLQGVYVWTLRVRYRVGTKEEEAFKAGEVLLLH